MNKKHNHSKTRIEDAPAIRISRSVSFPPDQDKWLTGLLGERGNLSGFLQALVDVARSGKINTEELLKNQKDTTVMQRAVSYLKAKEAAMLFEEDVEACLLKTITRGQKIVQGRIWNESTSIFIADFSVENDRGEVICSVVCKSSPRADRLQLALAEAMIGTQKTGRPVITVVPYFIEEGGPREVSQQFGFLGYPLTELSKLPDAVAKVTK